MIFDNGKKAENIAKIIPEENNSYEKDIRLAAVVLSESGYGDAKYLTHYESGNTFWKISDSQCVRYIKSTGYLIFN